MAVKISNSFGSYDRFKVMCPICGCELEYTRRDVRAHARWRNGFIYCPKCKSPIGHDEANIIEKGEEHFSSISETDLQKYTKEISVFRTLRTIFIPVGIVSLVASLVFIIAIITKVFITRVYVRAIFDFLFTVGLGTLLASGVLRTGIRNRQAILEHNK